MDGARSLDSLGQFLELRCQDLEFSGERLRIGLSGRFGGIHKRLQHHCDAGEDRFLNAVESFFEPRLLFTGGHVVTVNEIG